MLPDSGCRCFCSRPARLRWLKKWELSHWRFQTSIYTQHVDPEPDHVDHTKLINFEVWATNNWHGGLAFFDNSFGQNSQYAYIGKAWEIGQSEKFYWRMTAGLLHGYKEPYDEKIPFNEWGVATGRDTGHRLPPPARFRGGAAAGPFGHHAHCRIHLLKPVFRYYLLH